jgi:hypothetical protein
MSRDLQNNHFYVISSSSDGFISEKNFNRFRNYVLLKFVNLKGEKFYRAGHASVTYIPAEVTANLARKDLFNLFWVFHKLNITRSKLKWAFPFCEKYDQIKGSP